MKNEEIHLFIIWSNALEFLNEIIKDIDNKLIIKAIYKVEWSKENFSNNLTRFYGQFLPMNSDKEQHCGNEPFVVIIVEDKNPKYYTRQTTRGLRRVNINIFDLKAKFRALSGGGHKIHASDNTQESQQDIFMLLGKDIDYFYTLPKLTDFKNYPHIKRDLTGTNGWSSLEELLNVLNKFTNYLILRNFEKFPKEYILKEHGDIDILTDDINKIVYLTNAKKASPEPYRVYYTIKIKNEDIPFDFRYISDGYYDEKFEKDILKNKIFDNRGFFRPSNSDYFYSLLYHALIHKYSFSQDYKERLMNIAAKININSSKLLYTPQLVLFDFLYKQNYTITVPTDATVYYNQKVAKKFIFYKNLLEFFTNDEQDISVLSNEEQEKINYHISPLRINLLNWYPFEKESEILEINAETGILTSFLATVSKTLTVLEDSNLYLNINQIRNKNKTNITYLNTSLPYFEKNKKYDYVIIVEFLKYLKSYYNNSLNPLESFKNDILILSKKDTKLIFVIDNIYGFKYLNNKNDDKSFFRSKEDIIEYFKTFNAKEINFYYPIPDYIFVKALYSPEYYPDIELIKEFKDSLESNNNIEKIYQRVIGTKNFDLFANSFLVEVSL